MPTQKRVRSRVIDVQIHLQQPTAISKVVTRTANIAIRHGNILTLSDKTLPINRVTAIAITSILNTSVLVVAALVETRIDCHSSGVRKDEVGK